jgi:NAD(P)-dependent dehydrogenase (short-subunit alcohol dehydrogenase family)
MDPRGHAAIVTGGASGLGFACASALAQAGAKVALLDRNHARAAERAAGLGATAVPCDVADADNLAGAVTASREANGAARILVNCAGIGPSEKILDRDLKPMALDAFERVVRVNLLGTFNALRLAAADMATLPPLDDGERGVIVNLASIAAIEGQIGQAAYASSKGGVVGLTLPAARELARHGIRVVTLAPGSFDTEMFATVKPEWREKIVAGTPFPKRMGRPEELAELVLHVVRNRMLNGAVLRIDGGARLG